MHVSVVVPAYQAQRYLADTIRSVLAQTFEDFELVVLDNASTDATPEILRTMSVMSGYGGTWGIAGGWAIDLFLDRQTRPHDDLDVAVLRHDQENLRRHLGAARVEKVGAHGLSEWTLSERLEPQTDAIDDEPFDSRMSETTRIVYGKSSIVGTSGTSARSASAP